ncbi:hypothetical protein BDC45DRAFT_531373 [Circinella umbellata]|nr:hypothetical protein BDC45DRAFT_531373 [Circinella umbellata]
MIKLSACFSIYSIAFIPYDITLDSKIFKKSPEAKKKLKMDHDETKHIEQLDQADLKSTMYLAQTGVRSKKKATVLENNICCLKVVVKEGPDRAYDAKYFVLRELSRVKCQLIYYTFLLVVR